MFNAKCIFLVWSRLSYPITDEYGAGMTLHIVVHSEATKLFDHSWALAKRLFLGEKFWDPFFLEKNKCKNAK